MTKFGIESYRRLNKKALGKNPKGFADFGGAVRDRTGDL
jgi:hypothetical protein